MPAGEYRALLTDIKARIRMAQIKASLSVNRELIQLHWDIGGLIVGRQRAKGWGNSVVEKLALDIQKEFPGIEPSMWRGVPVNRCRSRLGRIGGKDCHELWQIWTADFCHRPCQKYRGDITSFCLRNGLTRISVWEYALRNLATPVGVARYTTKLVESLPAEFRGTLPSPKEIEAELQSQQSKQQSS